MGSPPDITLRDTTNNNVGQRMINISHEALEWLTDGAREFRSKECLSVLYGFTDGDYDKNKILEFPVPSEHLDEGVRKQYYEQACEAMNDIVAIKFSMVGWGIDQLKRKKFRRIDLDNEQIYIPPHLVSFLEGRKLCVDPNDEFLILEKPVSRAEIIDVLTRGCGPLLSDSLVNA